MSLFSICEKKTCIEIHWKSLCSNINTVKLQFHLNYTHFFPYFSVFYPCCSFWWFRELLCKTHRCQCERYLYATWIHLHILTIHPYRNGTLFVQKVKITLIIIIAIAIQNSSVSKISERWDETTKYSTTETIAKKPKRDRNECVNEIKGKKISHQ